MSEKKPIGWYTRGGKHIPVFEGSNVVSFDSAKKDREIAKNKKEADERNQVDNKKGWEYPEIKENVDKLEKSLSSAKSANKIQSIAIALREQDTRITQEIERLHNNTADTEGSENALLTQRRRIRQLMRKAKI